MFAVDGTFCNKSHNVEVDNRQVREQVKSIVESCERNDKQVTET